MKKIQKLKIIIPLIFFILFLPVVFISAAEILPSSEIDKIGVGSQFRVDILLDSQGESINALEGSLSFPKDLLELREIKDGGSIINFWVEEPKQTNQGISFSGIIPGGYNVDNNGLILSVIFYAKKEGAAFMQTKQAKAFLNDGEGSQTKTKISSLRVVVSKEMPPFIPEEKEDKNPPESFFPEISRDSSIFEGKWFLVFSTQDKQSGVDYYKVCEGEMPCVVAKSPYLLKNQELDKDIIIKAVDKAGNKRIITLPFEKDKTWYQYYLIIGIIILIIVYFIWRFLWRKRKF